MNNDSTTEKSPVAKKSNRKPRPPQGPEDTPPPVERVELQARPGWTAGVDAAAALLGLSRSAYIRQAVALKMQADRQAGLLPPPPPPAEGE